MNPFLPVAVQPIARIATGAFCGYEVLVPPEAFTTELELEIAARAFRAAAELIAPGERLFLDVSTAALQTPGFAAHLRSVAAMSGGRLDRTVVGIGGDAPIEDAEALLRNVDALRNAGALLALDDLGIGCPQLEHFDRLRPEYLKVSPASGRAFEDSRWRRSAVAGLQSFANEIGCELIVGGIDSAATADAASEIGIALGQGDYFGRPCSAEELLRDRELDGAA